jgi:hypothetical protein
MRYIFAACVNNYLTKNRDESVLFIEETISALLFRTKDLWLWSSFFAGNKSPMRIYFSEQVFNQLALLLTTPHANKPEILIEYLRTKALPGLYNHLETQLLGLATPAYAGREAVCSLLEQIVKLVNSLPASTDYKKIINTQVSVDKADYSYPCSDFQCEIIATIINQLGGLLPRTILPADKVKEIALGLEETDNIISVKLRITISDMLSAEECHRVFQAIRELPFWEKWQTALSGLLPQPLSLEARDERRDVIICIPLWGAQIPDRHTWKWNRFYSYVVEETHGSSNLKNYHVKAKEYIQDALPLDKNDLAAYMLAHLDGLFVQTYKSSRLLLESTPHTIKNILDHLGDESGNVKKTDLAAIEMQSLYRKILEVGDVFLREFDLNDLLQEIISKCVVFYPDIIFEVTNDKRDNLIILGSRGHILTAIWDIIHNAVKALKTLKNINQPKRVRISTAQKLDGIEVQILNNGPRAFDKTIKSFGMGSKNVKYVVCDIHGGSVWHAPIEEPIEGIDALDSFNYQWQLFFPHYPLSKGDD